MMLKSRFLIFAFILALVASACSENHRTVLVNPFVGTGGHGHTFPGATLPFGAVQLSPDTRLEGWDGCGGYHFSDSIIFGFSHTHLSGTGVSDYGDVLIMPMSTNFFWENGTKEGPDKGYASRFKKETEKAGPGWYEVRLEDDGIDVTLSSTLHCGLHTYRYGSGQQSPHIIIDLRHRDLLKDCNISIVNKHEIQGYRHSSAWAKDQKLFFVVRFSEDFQNSSIKKSKILTENGEHEVSSSLMLEFASQQSPTIKVAVGISAVDIDGARKNLDSEVQDWNFDYLQGFADATWEKQLEKIEIEGGKLEQQQNFYSALYHTCIAPNTFSDVDGRYRGMDGNIHQGQDTQYTVFSLWDTYRATHPLFTIIEQKRTESFIRSFLRMYQEGGRLPVWELAGNETDCMIGYHSVSVIADAYKKGLRNFDANLALKAMLASANADRLGLEYYKAQGFIGAGDESESVSKTLEYAYDDWCIATFAEALKQDSIATVFYQRAQFYKNVFDPQTGFFRAKMNGSWQEPFDPHEVNFNFTEANAWQYSLAVQQDIVGLIKLMGGKKALENHLDKLFAAQTATTGREQADITGLIGQYAHGNEPSHHMAWLYNYTDSPQKTQERVRQILNEMYQPLPDGLSGNEDCGQMSAWYVMSAMGLYPLTPGIPEYMVAAPLFPSIRINLENGKVFEISAPGTDEGKNYIQSVKLNGRPLEGMFITQAEIMEGGKLVFNMTENPEPNWAGKKPKQAGSEILGLDISPVPFFVYSSQTFSDSLEIKLSSVGGEDEEIFYAFVSDTGLREYKLYESPIILRETAKIEAYSKPKSIVMVPSHKASASFFKIDGKRSISIQTKYENQYAAGGDKALIDGLRGGPNFRTGRWQGYQGDLEAIVDLGEKKEIRRISMGFLQDIGSWVWMPKAIEISGSVNGKDWTNPITIENSVAIDDYKAQTQDLVYAQERPFKWRYVKFKAINFGNCPAWHLGAGGKAWIFSDEIVIE